MYCKKCGLPIEAGARFCGKCGTQVPEWATQVGRPPEFRRTPNPGPSDADAIGRRSIPQFNAHGAIAFVLVVAAGVALATCACLWAAACVGSQAELVDQLGFMPRNAALAGSIAAALVAIVPALFALVAFLPIVSLLARGVSIRRLPVRAFVLAAVAAAVCLASWVFVGSAGSLPAIGGVDPSRFSVLLGGVYGETAPISFILAVVALACEAACLFGPFTADRRHA